MTALSQPISNISDTALWAANFRAEESDRPDALFHDHLARRLGGDRALNITLEMVSKRQHAWSWVARTYLYDRYIERCVGGGADLVLNLAAGLDARPYRMALPPHLIWIEVDLPQIIEYKSEVLKDETPACKLERVGLDLSDVDARRRLFEEVGRRCKNAVVVTEGLIIYFETEEVKVFARDLHEQAAFEHWILDLASPGLLKILQKQIGPQLSAGGAPLKFGPAEGAEFYRPLGWEPVEVRGMMKTAKMIKRLPFRFQLFALFPDSPGKSGRRPWGGVGLFARRSR